MIRTASPHAPRRGRIPRVSEVDQTRRQSLAERRGAIRKRGYAEAKRMTSREILANRLATAVKQGGARRLVGRRMNERKRIGPYMNERKRIAPY